MKLTLLGWTCELVRRPADAKQELQHPARTCVPAAPLVQEKQIDAPLMYLWEHLPTKRVGVRAFGPEQLCPRDARADDVEEFIALTDAGRVVSRELARRACWRMDEACAEWNAQQQGIWRYTPISK